MAYITTEEFDKYLDFAVERLQSSDVRPLYSPSRIKNLFVLPSLQFRNMDHAKVKMGTRDLFIDTPRGADDMLWCIYSESNRLGGDLEEENPGLDKAELGQMIVERLKAEKDDEGRDIGELSKILYDLDISWNVSYAPFSNRPIIKYEVEKYYLGIWKNKVKQFINDLNGGEDSPVGIYKKSRSLTMKYEQLMEPKNEGIPYIIQFMLEKDSPYLSIYSELERLNKLFEKTRKTLQNRVDDLSSFMLEFPLIDIKTIFQQIKYILRSGSCFPTFLLLRKLLVVWGLLMFEYFTLNTLESTQTTEDVKPRDEFLDMWINSFKEYDEWCQLNFVGEFLALETIKPEKNSDKKETITIFNLDKFKKKIDKKDEEGIRQFLGSSLDPRDRFLVEVLDVARVHKTDVISFVKKDLKISPAQKLFYEDEYRKLCDVVHEVICPDYPLFGSFLEYLGFLHHLRKINKLLASIPYSKLQGAIGT